MDVETIKKFIEAGYTKTDIDAMQSGNTEGSESTKTKEGTEGTETKEGTEGTKTNQQANMDAKPDISQGAEVDKAFKALSDTVAELSDTIKKMQENNVRNADGGTSTDKIKDVMDSFIKEL